MSEESVVEIESNEFTEIEQEAIRHGWNPEGVEGKTNLSGEEFMARQPLYNDLKKQGRKIRELEQAIQSFAEHNKKIAEVERNKAIAELKEQKKAAYANEDWEAITEIDEKIADTKATPTVQPINTIFSDWVDRNSWYQEDDKWRIRADGIGQSYSVSNPNATYEDVLAYVENEIRELRKSVTKQVDSPVEGVGNSRKSSVKGKKFSRKDLTSEEQKFMDTALRIAPSLTEEEYLRQVFEIRG